MYSVEYIIVIEYIKRTKKLWLEWNKVNTWLREWKKNGEDLFTTLQIYMKGKKREGGGKEEEIALEG